MCFHPDSDDPFKDLQEGLDALQAADPTMVPEDLSVEKLVHVDSTLTRMSLQLHKWSPMMTSWDSFSSKNEEDGCEEFYDIALSAPVEVRGRERPRNPSKRCPVQQHRG